MLKSIKLLKPTNSKSLRSVKTSRKYFPRTNRGKYFPRSVTASGKSSLNPANSTTINFFHWKLVTGFNSFLLCTKLGLDSTLPKFPNFSLSVSLSLSLSLTISVIFLNPKCSSLTESSLTEFENPNYSRSRWKALREEELVVSTCSISRKKMSLLIWLPKNSSRSSKTLASITIPLWKTTISNVVMLSSIFQQFTGNQTDFFFCFIWQFSENSENSCSLRDYLYIFE